MHPNHWALETKGHDIQIDSTAISSQFMYLVATYREKPHHMSYMVVVTRREDQILV